MLTRWEKVDELKEGEYRVIKKTGCGGLVLEKKVEEPTKENITSELTFEFRGSSVRGVYILLLHKGSTIAIISPNQGIEMKNKCYELHQDPLARYSFRILKVDQ